MSRVIKLNMWAFGTRVRDRYTPPELGFDALTGLCEGHPKFVDGTKITTSRIESVKGRIVKT